MLTATEFRDLVSGRRRGWLAAGLRLLLSGAESPYRSVVRVRNALYDVGLAKSHQVGVPVISVGNLTLGGTGKTPAVRWLAEWFRNRDVRVAILSRGYKAQPGVRNDEAEELAAQLPGVPHLQDPDRVRAARRAVQDACQLILLDDAFQHRRLHRDLNIALVDALDPYGSEHVFPRGTLREPLAGLSRADVVALSRADAVSEAVRDSIRQRLLRYAPRALWLELTHRPLKLLAATGQRLPLDSLHGCRVAAFCGIGNPAGFRHTLQACGVETTACREFPDHHAYTERDLAALSDWAASWPQITALLCTAKDLVKIKRERLGPCPLWAVEIGLEITLGREAFETRLQELL